MFDDEREFVALAREFPSKCKYSSRDGLEFRKADLVNTVANLRFALDYLADRIFTSLREKRDLPPKEVDVYFPFAMGESGFARVCQKNLPQLKEVMPDVYSIVEGAQPYKCGDSWLVRLCEEAAPIKHKSRTITENVGRSSIDLDGIIVGEGRMINCFVQNCTFNGVTYNIRTDEKGYVHDLTGTAEGKYSSRTSTDLVRAGEEVLPFILRCATNVEKLTLDLERALK